MYTKYNIITKTKYKDFCEKTNDIQIVENNLEMRKITLMDKFGNICPIEYKDDDTIQTLTRFGENDPVYMLYLLVTIADAKFLSEDEFKNYVQLPLMNEPDCKMVKINNSTYEEFTKYFMDYVKYERDFDKEFQLINEKGQTDSNITINESNLLEGGNNIKIKNN
jgi:hypothetical protein